MRARLAVYYSGQAIELREVVLKNKPEQMLAVSPKGTVPVMLVDGAVIDESLEIMQWSLERNDPDGWLESVDGSVIENHLIKELDDDFKPLLDKYKYFDRHPEYTQEEHLQQALPFLKRLNNRIKSSSGQYLDGDCMSALDAAVFPFIRQFANSDLKRFTELALHDLQSWLETCVADDLFLSVMKKYPAWTAQESNSILLKQNMQTV